MKTTILIIALSIIQYYSFGQKDKEQSMQLKVIKIKSFENGYLIKGVSVEKKDTIYFLSLKDTSCIKGMKKIKTKNEYIFHIQDMDNEHLPALPNGYFLKMGKYYLKREGRNGSTITTTQYKSVNTNGLYLN